MSTILVTGANGALGSAICARLVADGREVIGVGRSQHQRPGQQQIDWRGGVDLSSAEQAQALADDLRRSGIGLDGVVNAAGGFVLETVRGGDPASWARMQQINAMTTLNACRSFVPLMGKPSAIVNIGAAAADRADAGMGAYTASKAAVIRMSEALSKELRAEGIRVNVVSPTIIDTPANRADMPDADRSDWVQPDKIANLVSFLLSDQALAINGQNIRIG